MEGFTSKIVESNRNLTKKEQVKMKALDDCIRIDSVVTGHEDSLLIDVDYYAIVEVHNENCKKDKDKDYTKLIIVDKNGSKYVTGSAPFMSSFKEIMQEMSGSDEEWQLKAFRRPSVNYPDRDFFSCTIE